MCMYLGDMFATPSYTASKHAVTALTRTFGVSYQ
jgi:NAD(P)-dependent dehydrogenase (short-subunit alcohol dehydrogenase family)